jgi:hypothetical protein
LTSDGEPAHKYKAYFPLCDLCVFSDLCVLCGKALNPNRKERKGKKRKVRRAKQGALATTGHAYYSKSRHPTTISIMADRADKLEKIKL